ncbi:MAG: GNAT family N-acetyltransferase [Clostridia bacterium]|nr:GNAT family N-acetyltransferase [Clostridia bacterium]
MSARAVFRRAEKGDMSEIMRVVHEAQAFMRGLDIDQWQDGYPDAATLERDIELKQLYVFAQEGRVCAVAALSLLPEPVYDALEGEWLSAKQYLTVHRMALDDASRGRGLATDMLSQAVRIAGENGCASVRVDTHRGNLAMRRFLEKNGFAYCGIVHYYVKLGDPMRVAYEKLI